MSHNIPLQCAFAKNTNVEGFRVFEFDPAFIPSSVQEPVYLDNSSQIRDENYSLKSIRNGRLPRSMEKKAREKTDPQYKASSVLARKNLADELSDLKPNSLSIYRLRKGLTQSDLADLIGTSQSHIAKIENGALNVFLSTAVKIADVLQITLDDLSRAIKLDQNASKGKVIPI